MYVLEATPDTHSYYVLSNPFFEYLLYMASLDMFKRDNHSCEMP